VHNFHRDLMNDFQCKLELPMNEGVFLSKHELQELVEIRQAVDTFYKVLDASAESIGTNEAAAVLRPIATWLGDFTDKVYARVGKEGR